MRRVSTSTVRSTSAPTTARITAFVKTDQLSRLRLFEKVELKPLRGLLRECQFTELAVGDTLIEAGKRNDSMYLLLSGRLQLYLDSGKATPVTTIGPGESVGEISIMDQLPASAAVVASKISRLLVIPRETFWRLIARSHGVAANLLAILAQRLRDNNSTIGRGEQQVQLLLESTGEAIYGVDLEGNCTFVNPACLRMLGFEKPQDLVGQNIHVLLHGSGASSKSKTADQCGLCRKLREGETLEIDEQTLYRRDGTNFVAEYWSSAIYRDGDITGYVVTFADVTERKRIEAERLKLSSAIEQTADVIMITDRDGVIEYVNPAFEQTTGYSRSEVIGKTPKLLKSDKHDERFAQRLWETILSGHVFRDVFINCKKDGQIFYEDKTITPLTDRGGEITHFIATGKDITEQMAAQERLRYLAQHDPLTEVPNRNLLMDRLNQALAQARGGDRAAAVLFLDLDRFKLINDTLGHDAGDQVLLAVSQRLRKCVRKSDTVARLGGDEFALVLSNINEPQDIAAIARGILEIFTHPIELKDREVFVTASMGISVYPYNSEDAASLLQQAHIAACQAKEKGRNNFQFFSLKTQTTKRSVDRLNMETDLRRALERGEFLLHYQPQVDLDGNIVGLEALIRWKHPEHGLVAPVEFISLLEETGLIVPVGEWVLRSACRQARLWNAAGITFPYLSVNLSARQLDDKGLLAIVDKLRRDMPRESMSLELEITESVIMRHGDVPVETLRALHAMGVRLTIDDFGTGYSSLAYLKRFPIQTLKIDRSFIKDLTVDADDDAIVSAVIALARGLGLNVVAEGVETPEQLRFLRSKRCYSVQGYLFSKPLPVDEITGMLQTGKPLTPTVRNKGKSHAHVSKRVRSARPRQGAL
jgi:diguanylate cyclase (GGDEF)-like protein/PAS domain S-box-containing protein